MNNRIYCWNCGTKHAGKDTTCEQCGKNLDTKHLDFISFCTKTAKGKIKDKVYSKTLDIVKDWITSNLYRIFVTVAAIFVVTSVTVNVSANSKTNSNANSVLGRTVVVDCSVSADADQDVQPEGTVEAGGTADNTKQLSNNIEDYTVEKFESYIGIVVKETEYYYGPSEAFDIYKDIVGDRDMGHPLVGQGAIVYGQCKETGWWLLDLGRSGSYPDVYVPEDCIATELE